MHFWGIAVELEVKSLKILLTVAECASYSRAAHKLGVTQPAVSRRILDLEKQLKTRLFRREGHRFVLTETGKAVCEQARQIDRLMERIQPSIQELTGKPSGSVVVGLPSGVGEMLAARLVRKFRASYPGVMLRLEQGYASDLSQMLASNYIDVAILHGKHNSPLFHITPLVQLELGLVYPSAWRTNAPSPIRLSSQIALADTVDLPFIIPSQQQPMRARIEDAYRDLGGLRNIVLECNGLGLAKSLAREGLGCMILSNSSLNKTDLECLSFARIHAPRIEWTACMATRSEGEPTLAAKLLARMLQCEIEDLVRAGDWYGSLIA